MAWSADGTRLLIPDPVQKEIFVYRADGSQEERLPRPGRTGLESSSGTRVAAAEEGTLLQYRPSHLVRVTAEGKVAGGVDIGGRVFAGERRVGRLLTWTAVDDWVYGFGEVRREGGVGRAGWLRFTHAGKPRLELLREVALAESERRYYSLGFPYAAAVGGRAYLLVMEEEPYLLEMAGTHQRRLSVFPEGFDRRPKLPPARREQEEVLALAAVEEARLPVGLFGRGNRLYVLTRRPACGGATIWEVTGIDPLSERVVSRARLPTVAPHLTAAPGPERWAFLEKGPMSRARLPRAKSLLFVPASWLQVPRARGWVGRRLTPLQGGG